MTPYQYRVPYADTDQMGVVYYANYLIYFERARTELLRQCGFSYLEMEQDQLALPVAEAFCSYRKPAKYDDLIELTAKVAEIRGARIRIEYEIRCKEELLVSGYTVHACFNMQTKRPVRVPEHIQKILL